MPIHAYKQSLSIDHLHSWSLDDMREREREIINECNSHFIQYKSFEMLCNPMFFFSSQFDIGFSVTCPKVVYLWSFTMNQQQYYKASSLYVEWMHERYACVQYPPLKPSYLISNHLITHRYTLILQPCWDPFMHMDILNMIFSVTYYLELRNAIFIYYTSHIFYQYMVVWTL